MIEGHPKPCRQSLRAAEIQAMVEEAADKSGRFDGLMNNAGIQFVSLIEEFPAEKWDQIIAINLSAAFHAIRRAVPIMKAASLYPFAGRVAVQCSDAAAIDWVPVDGGWVAE